MQYAAKYAHHRLASAMIGPNLPQGENVLATIGTHDGSFHCDEAMACGMLRHTRCFEHATIVRTRNPDILAKCQAVVDVGTVYDVALQRFDHHQKEFQGGMETSEKKYATRLSSAGLIYRHFGREILRDYTEHCVQAGRLSATLTEAQLSLLYDRVYKTFVEHIDGIDNGVEEYAVSGEGSLVRNYSVSSTLSSRIRRLYPRWNQAQTREAEDSAFLDAMTLATTEFFENVDYNACAWLPARSIVQDAFNKCGEIDQSNQILVFGDGGCPWKDHLVDIEKAAGVEGRTLFVLYPDQKKQWRVQAVNKANSSFANRKSLPWRGLRDDDLCKASGIDGGIFVHVGGFIGGNKTYEGALAMAKYAVTAPEDA